MKFIKSFVTFTGKELTELRRSGRLLIFLILFVLLGVLNPATAKLTPWLLSTMADSLESSGITVTAYTVTAMDSWVQFFKNMDVCRIENLPTISDVDVISKILIQLGAKVNKISSSVIEIDSRELSCAQVSQDLAKNMRASYYMLGALLGRFGRARVPMPGGCYFGVRPIDQHLKGFEALGAKTGLRDGIISLTAEDGLKGACIPLDVVSVGATINIMLAAVRAKGLTVIEHAAKEPHIVDLANFLNSMGADVRGAGTDVIKIRGVSKMHGATYSIIPDQIEAGTYMIAAAATGGDITIKNVTPKHMESISKKLMEMGVEIYEYDDSMRITRSRPLRWCNVTTMPHPGFPTDMQPQMAAAMSIAQGVSTITEGVWENRFQYVEELKKLGAGSWQNSARL